MRTRRTPVGCGLSRFSSRPATRRLLAVSSGAAVAAMVGHRAAQATTDVFSGTANNNDFSTLTNFTPSPASFTSGNTPGR
jgi:hypothetical protein